MRAATAPAWARPPSARCSPLARPGRVAPVVGVWPCRTSRSRVLVGAAGFLDREVAGIGRLNLPAAPRASARAGARGTVAAVDSFDRLHDDVVTCRACPRLVAWREEVGREKRAAFR